MLDFLCEKIKKVLKKYDIKKIYELRIRQNLLYVNYNGEYVLEKVTIEKQDLFNMLNEICQHSVYAYSDSIREGFVSGKCGERVGISGTFSYEKGQIVSVKDVTSFCVRVPHEVLGCSEKVFSLCKGHSFLIASAPGLGKTTILRDVARLISDKLYKNVVVIDEKFELSDDFGIFNLGNFTDIMRGIKKTDGLKLAIKNLKPDYLILDEIYSVEECDGLNYALSCGVKIVCSIHAQSIKDLKVKTVFKKCLENKLFDYYVFLGGSIGNVQRVLNGEGEIIV